MTSRLLRFSAVISILCGGLVFFLFRFYGTPGARPDESGTSNSGAGFAVLVLDESRDDRQIRESLARGGIDDVISESSQELPVDDFGELKMIPLDTFRNEIETFDPRDDGYAAKLDEFFVRDGKRFFFLPLKSLSGIRMAALKKQLSSLLGETPFTLGILGRNIPVLWYFALLAAACVFVLYFSPSRRLFVFELPVLLAFGWGGASAFFLGAVLSGIWELLREPMGEISASRRYGRLPIYAGAGFRGLWERLKPFRLNCFLVLLFLVFLVLFSFFGDLSPLPLVVGCVCFFLLYFLAFRIEAERIRKNRHILFTPVPLFPFKVRTFSLFPVLLPFGAGAALAVFLPAFLPAFSSTRGQDPALVDTRYLVSAEDYYRHVNFERSFSYRSLNENQDLSFLQVPDEGAFEREEYLRYNLGADGLIGKGESYPPEDREELVPAEGPRTEGRWTGGPPFPLEKLMNFLVNYSKPAGSGSGDIREPQNAAAAVKSWELIGVVIIFAACILDLLPPGIRGKKMKKVPIFRDKRIAA